MKKIALLLVITLVLGLSVLAYAGATKYTLIPGSAAIGSESGFVIIHYVKEDKTIGQIQVRGLVPGMYEVMVVDPPGDPLLGTIEVKKNGSGHLHVMRDDAEPTNEPFTINIVNGSGEVVLFASIPSFP